MTLISFNSQIVNLSRSGAIYLISGIRVIFASPYDHQWLLPHSLCLVCIYKFPASPSTLSITPWATITTPGYPSAKVHIHRGVHSTSQLYVFSVRFSDCRTRDVQSTKQKIGTYYMIEINKSTSRQIKISLWQYFKKWVLGHTRRDEV